MLDREVRDRLALALRRFTSGRLTRDELEAVEVAAERSPDPGVLELCDEIY